MLLALFFFFLARILATLITMLMSGLGLVSDDNIVFVSYIVSAPLYVGVGVLAKRRGILLTDLHLAAGMLLFIFIISGLSISAPGGVIVIITNAILCAIFIASYKTSKIA